MKMPIARAAWRRLKLNLAELLILSLARDESSVAEAIKLHSAWSAIDDLREFIGGKHTGCVLKEEGTK